MDLLISGASKGIGRATALVAAEKGHQVLALARDREALEALARERSGILPLPLDLRDERLEELLKEGVMECGVKKLDGVVHAAGILEKKPFQELEKEDWEKVLGGNLIGPARSLQVLHPWLLRGQVGHVVLLGSMAGHPGSKKFPGMCTYGASKAALGGLGELLAEEWRSDGIHVNTLVLGGVDTGMFRQAFPGGEAPVSAGTMGAYVLSFLEEGGKVMSGQQVPVSVSTP